MSHDIHKKIEVNQRYSLLKHVILPCILIVCSLYVMPTWQDYPAYQSGLHGYPEHMGTMFGTIYHIIWAIVLVATVAVASSIAGWRYIQKQQYAHAIIKRKRLQELLKVGVFLVSLCISITLLGSRYYWRQPENFSSDPFLYGFRERLQHTLNAENIREWLTRNAYNLNNPVERTDTAELAFPDSILQMLRIHSGQSPWLRIAQQHLWISIDGWDQHSFGVVVGAINSSPPQIWRCLPFEEGVWVVVEYHPAGGGVDLNKTSKNACQK